MIKKTITYTDLNGGEQKEDFFFNLNKAEAIAITAQAGGDIIAYAQYLMESKDLQSMIGFIQEMILMAVGVKSEDGRRFIKNTDIRADFENSIAYAELFEELLTNQESMKEFGAGLIAVPTKKEDTPQLRTLPGTTHDQTIGEIAKQDNRSPQEVLEELIKANPDLVKNMTQPNT